MLHRSDTRIFTFWFLLTVCMILHFNYHVSDIFYGIDVTRPNANGTKPFSLIIIRFVFEILPMAFAIAMLYLKAAWFRKVTFGVSLIYTLSNTAHVIGKLKEGEPSQLILLNFVLIFSVLLSIESWKWMKTV